MRTPRLSRRRPLRAPTSPPRPRPASLHPRSNLPFKITAEEMYDIFGKYGAIRQIRVGSAPETKGTAFVVYEDIYDAKAACEHLSGFNVGGRYLVVLYYQPNRGGKVDRFLAEEELKMLRARVAAGDAVAAGAASTSADADDGGALDDEEERRHVGANR